MNPIVFLYKAVHWILSRIGSISHSTRTRMIFLGNGVEHSSFRTTGVPYLVVARGGKMKVGSNFAMNNGIKGNPIGCYDKCTFFVDKGAELIIGENVGISQTALISHCSLRVGNNVKMGGDFRLYD